jgi:AcrR family transcriptional regulator
MTGRRTNAQMSEATRHQLLGEARRAFAEHGYGQAPIEEVVRACGLTRGAIYHHFGSKQGLFLAVMRELDREILERITAGDRPPRSGDPVAELLRACRGYLEATTDPGVRRILLVDGPAVLATLGDAAEVRAASEASIRPLRDGLAELDAIGWLRACDLEVTASMLGGALFEAALWIGASARPKKALDAAMHSLALLLEGVVNRPTGRAGAAAG